MEQVAHLPPGLLLLVARIPAALVVPILFAVFLMFCLLPHDLGFIPIAVFAGILGVSTSSRS
jgi:hypothetical protein